MKATKEVKAWAGPAPAKCDVCGASIKAVFWDEKTVYGPWGILCPVCHLTHGVGIGQRYRKLGQKYIKVEG